MQSRHLRAPVPVWTPVDPRIRRRRVEVRRAEGRRRLRVVVGAVILSLTIVGAWALLHSPLLDVDQVEVTGVANLDPADVQSVIGIAAGTALIDIDEQALEERVLGIGWVADVNVSREWPSTVRVEVTERIATAVTREDDDHWALLDATGRVVEMVDARPEGLVVVEGLVRGDRASGQPVAGATSALAVARALPASMQVAIEAVRVAPGGVDIKLKQGGVVLLGPPERIPEKVRALATVLARVDTAGLAVLDLRQPSRPSLTRQ